MRYLLCRPAIRAAGAAWPSARRAVMAGTAAAGLAAAAAAAAYPASAAHTGTPRTTPVTAAAGPTRQAVPLVTGGQVTVTSTPGGPAVVSLRPGPGGPGAMGIASVYRDPAGDSFVVPAVAVPFVGRELSPSLFDVSALARDHITGSARIPVRLAFTAGAAPAAPPGVTLTSVHGRFARGYLTAASARVFGAAVSRQARTAARTGVLFGNLARISLAAPAAPAATLPAGRLHTVRIVVTGLNGQPDPNACITLTNTDDARLTPNGGIVGNINGVGTIKAPAGHYSVNVGFECGLRNPTSVHVVQVNDFRVPDAARVTTVRVHERSATTRVSVTVPRPVRSDQADPQTLMLIYDRVSAKGPAENLGYLVFGADRIAVFVNPQPAAKIGKLFYLAWFTADGPATGPQYGFSVAAFSGDIIPARQRRKVVPSQVATVREHASADPTSGLGTWEVSGDPYAPALHVGARTSTEPSLWYPQAVVGISVLHLAPVRGAFTMYLVGPRGEPWAQSAQVPGKAGDTFLDAELRQFAAGHTYSVSWRHGPLAPRLGQHTSPWKCGACAAGHTLTLVFSPAGDSDPGHFVPIREDLQVPSPGVPQREPVSRFTLLRDGHVLVSARGAFGAVARNVPATPATFRAVLTDDLSHLGSFTQSARTTTDLTIHYTPGTGASLPAASTCTGQSARTPCRVLPALTLNYRLATGQTGTSTARTQVLHLQAAHVSYNGHGSHSKITSARVSVSFDGGRTWHAAAITGSNGRYIATWHNPTPGPGVHPEIKATATDAEGNTITQTITNAYTLGTAAPRSG